MPSPVFDGNAVFYKKDWNNTLDNWRRLKTELKDLGYDLITADDNLLDGCEWIIFIDSTSIGGLQKGQTWPKRHLYEEALKRGLRGRMILFLWEGKAVNPKNYDKKVWDMFDYIFTWDDGLVDDKKFFKFFLPIPDTAPVSEALPFDKKKLLVNITINKYSRDKNELYSARRRTISYFAEHYPDDFDMFGTRWNQPVTRWQRYLPWLVKRYKNYHGMTEDKIGTLSKYRFALCYENLSGAKGYVTEKIFDAFKAGAVPIYWGADNIGDYVDQETFIDRRRFKSDAELAAFLEGIAEKEHSAYVEAGKRFLQSSRYRRFLPSNFCDSIIKALGLDGSKRAI